MSKREKVVVFIALLIVVGLLMSGLVWLVCWAFGIAFSWKYVVGVWALMFLYNLFTKN